MINNRIVSGYSVSTFSRSSIPVIPGIRWSVSTTPISCSCINSQPSRPARCGQHRKVIAAHRLEDHEIRLLVINE